MTLLHDRTCTRLYINFKYLNSFNILVHFISDDEFLDPKRHFYIYIFCYD